MTAQREPSDAAVRTAATAPGRDPAGAAIDAVVAALWRRQRDDGSWQDHLPSAAVSTGIAIAALHAAAPLLPDPAIGGLVAGGARWLRDNQDAGGGWGDAPGAPATLNATAVADAALRFARVDGCGETLHRSAGWIDRHGGADAVGDRDRCTLGVIPLNLLAEARRDGETGGPATRVPVRLPYELILLPRPLRQKLSFTVPGLMAFGLMHAHARRTGPVRRALARLAEPRALDYLAGIQRYEDSTGSSLSAPVGGYQESPLMASVVCFGLSRSGLPATAGPARDIVERCVRFLRATVRPDGSWPVNRDLEFSASMFCVHGLLDAGLAGDPRLARTHDWIHASRRRTGFPATGVPAGGWGWSMPSGWPDVDDTASALIALSGFGDRSAPVAGGVRWLLDLQNRDGSWGCFTRNAPVTLDAPCSVFTAHATLALHVAGGLGPQDRPVARALRWFRGAQRPDGSFAALWYRDHTSGTARVLHTLGRLGLGGTDVAAGCRDWLLGHQNPDGGWGDGAGGGSTAEETAWALLGLVDAGLAGHAAADRATAWLAGHQRPDGLWRPALLGVYFLDLMYDDDLICAGYALQALARRQAALRREAAR